MGRLGVVSLGLRGGTYVEEGGVGTGISFSLPIEGYFENELVYTSIYENELQLQGVYEIEEIQPELELDGIVEIEQEYEGLFKKEIDSVGEHDE